MGVAIHRSLYYFSSGLTKKRSMGVSTKVRSLNHSWRAIVHSNHHLQELAKEKYISLPPGLLHKFEWHFMLKSQNNLRTSEFGQSLHQAHRSYQEPLWPTSCSGHLEIGDYVPRKAWSSECRSHQSLQISNPSRIHVLSSLKLLYPLL